MDTKNNEQKHDFVVGFDTDLNLGEMLFSLLDEINEAEKKQKEKKEPYQVAICVFRNGERGEYNFRMYDDHKYKVGDIVVVDTLFGFDVATIVKIVPEAMVDVKPTRDVVCPVDRKAFDERKKHKEAEERDKTKCKLKNFVLVHHIDKDTMEAVINECFKA